MSKSNDHFIQVGYTKNFSQNIKSRKSNISIISPSLTISQNGVAENFSNSKGMLLNCFDKKEKDINKENSYNFYWQEKEYYLSNFLKKNIKKDQNQIKEYFSLLWSRNLFSYDDARKQLKLFKEKKSCELPETILNNLNLQEEIKNYPVNSCFLRNKILMERFIYFLNEINNYNVEYFKSESEIFLLGENPVFHISVLNDNDFLNLESMFNQKPDRNLFNNLIFVPISWNEFYYLYKNETEKQKKENLINQVIEYKIYNKYAVWMSSKQTLINDRNKNIFEDIKNFYYSVKTEMQANLIKNKE